MRQFIRNRVKDTAKLKTKDKPRKAKFNPGVIEMLKEAEAEPSKQAEPEPAPHLRREKRLIPEVKPLDWFTTFDKYADSE